MTPLAQISQDMLGPAGVFVGCIVAASATMFLLNQALTFWKEHMRERPVPAETYATKTEHAELVAELKAVVEKSEERWVAVLAETNTRFAAIAKTSSESREKIFTLIREQTDKTQANMAVQFSGVSTQLAGVHAQLFDVIRSTSELRGEVKRIAPSNS